MKNLGLLLASLAGMTGEAFYIPSFLATGLSLPRAIGKLHDLTWRQSKGAKSRKSRANRRKAKRRKNHA